MPFKELFQRRLVNCRTATTDPAYFQQVMAVLNNFCSRLRENGDYFSTIGRVLAGVFASGLQLGSNLLGQFGGTFDKAGLAVGLLVKVLTKVALAALGISGSLV